MCASDFYRKRHFLVDLEENLPGFGNTMGEQWRAACTGVKCHQAKNIPTETEKFRIIANI
jgi:hypothetical protein